MVDRYPAAKPAQSHDEESKQAQEAKIHRQNDEGLGIEKHSLEVRQRAKRVSGSINGNGESSPLDWTCSITGTAW